MNERDFSLVLGGPLFQLWRRTRLSDELLHLLRRRLIVMTFVAWAPLLVLSIAEGTVWGGPVALPFLRDLDTQIRLLLVLPLLILAELVVNERLGLVVGQFVERDLIPDAAQAKFDAAFRSVLRLRNSITAEVLMIAFVYLFGIGFLWRTQGALDVTSWYGTMVGGSLRPSGAGRWLSFVSLPLLQFLLLRWYFRLLIWTRFLWQVSRIELKLLPTHADGCGGVGFLSLVSSAFYPLLLAQGLLLSGMMANRIFFAGVKLTSFQFELIGVVLVMVFAILGPLLLFTPRLAKAKRVGIREYGALVQGYARAFDQKWLRGGAPHDEPLIGSADIQSLADIGNSFEVVKEMRIIPFTWHTVAQLAFVTLAPVLPLLLTMISPEELLHRLIQAMF